MLTPILLPSPSFGIYRSIPPVAMSPRYVQIKTVL